MFEFMQPAGEINAETTLALRETFSMQPARPSRIRMPEIPVPSDLALRRSFVSLFFALITLFLIVPTQAANITISNGGTSSTAIDFTSTNTSDSIIVASGVGTYSGIISSDPLYGATLVKEGLGTLIYTGYGGFYTANTTFSGLKATPGVTVAIAAGTLQIGNGTASVGFGGATATGYMSGFIQNNGTLALYQAGSGSLTSDAVISGPGNVVLKGSGVTTYTFNSRQSYSGSTTIETGARLNANGGLDGNVINNGHISAIGGTFSGNFTGTGTFALNDSTIGGSYTPTGPTTTTGDVTLMGSVSGYITISSGNLTFDQSSSTTCDRGIAGDGTFTKAGAGTLTVTGDYVYTGATTIAGGTLLLGASERLPNSTAVTVATGAALDLGGYSETVSSLAGGGSVRLGSGTLTSSSSASTTFSGAISGTGGAFVKAGSGTLILTGANTYTGGTTISGGTLQIGDGGSTGSLAGSVVNNSALVVNRTGTLEMTGGISGTGTFTKTGSANLTISADNTCSGTTTLSGGTVTLNSSAPFGTGTLVLDGAELSSSGTARTLANAVTLFGDSTISGSQPVTFSGTVTLARNRDLTISNTVTLSGSIGETGGGRGLNKYGAGELRITGANTYSGGTYIGAGTVRINNTTGSAFGTGAVTVAAGATLAGNGSFTGALQLNGIYSPGNSPGTASPGATNWAGGGGYVWELNNASDAPGAKGVTYDWMNIGGQLSIDSTSGSKFTIYVTTLTAGNAAGVTPGFTYGTTYHWVIASGTSIANFSADKFTIDTSAFFNDSANLGGFTIAQSGNDIVLNLTYVPEPGQWGAILGATLLASTLRRRRLV